jgi:hypothetical protein
MSNIIITFTDYCSWVWILTTTRSSSSYFSHNVQALRCVERFLAACSSDVPLHDVPRLQDLLKCSMKNNVINYCNRHLLTTLWFNPKEYQYSWEAPPMVQSKGVLVLTRGSPLMSCLAMAFLASTGCGTNDASMTPSMSCTWALDSSVNYYNYF